MNFGAAFWVGVLIFLVGLVDKKWAAILTLAGFIPFWLATVTGIIGVTIDPSTASNATANIMNQGTNMIFDKIVGTYFVGIILGWVPQMFLSSKTARG
jgi:hypothetical protein